MCVCVCVCVCVCAYRGMELDKELIHLQPRSHNSPCNGRRYHHQSLSMLDQRLDSAKNERMYVNCFKLSKQKHPIGSPLFITCLSHDRHMSTSHAYGVEDSLPNLGIKVVSTLFFYRSSFAQ